MNPNTEFIICGDININDLVDTYRKSQLNSLLISYNLFDTDDFPTEIQILQFLPLIDIFINFSRQGNFVMYLFIMVYLIMMLS